MLEVCDGCQEVCHLDFLSHVLGVLVCRHHEPSRAHGESDVLDSLLAGDVPHVVDHGWDVILAILIPSAGCRIILKLRFASAVCVSHPS